MADAFPSLAGRLLLAMPGMGDPRFERSVNALFLHDAGGAFAIGIGSAITGASLHQIMAGLDIDPGAARDLPVLAGGPVEPQRGFVIHSLDWQGEGTLVCPALGGVTGSLDILRAIAAGTGPERYLFALGYAGWSPGQLDGEMQRHGWHAAAGHAAVLWDTPPEKRWEAAWRAEGIDPALLANETGRA